jgi:hypothetical protein
MAERTTKLSQNHFEDVKLLLQEKIPCKCDENTSALGILAWTILKIEGNAALKTFRLKIPIHYFEINYCWKSPIQMAKRTTE